MPFYEDIIIDEDSNWDGESPYRYRLFHGVFSRQASVPDLLRAIGDAYGSEIYELGVDVLPPDMPDIRGRIRHEPARVFGYYDFANDGSSIPQYFGLVEN